MKTTAVSEAPGSRDQKKNQTPLMRRFILFSVTLFLIVLVAGSVTFVLSMRQIIRTNKGNELAQMIEIERLKLEASVNSEIAIALKMANSPLIQSYFAHPQDPGLKEQAFDELASYRNAFQSNSVFWITDWDKIFYFDNEPSYVLDPEDPDYYWYPMTMQETEVYNFNIDYDPGIQMTNLWINAPVFDEHRNPLGIVGTGVDLSAFISDIYRSYTGDAELYFFNAAGEITGAKDVGLVAEKKGIEEHWAGRISDIIAQAESLRPGETKTLDISWGKVSLCALPSLEWYATAFLPIGIDDYNNPLTLFFLMVVALIAILFVVFNVFIAGLLKPLRKTMEELEAVSAAKSEFLATMSHEIRTPMNAILGITQIQMRKEGLPDEYAAALEKIYSSGNNLLGIINDILDMSKIETGKLDLHCREYDTPTMINDAVQWNIVRIGEKPIEFILDVDENLPQLLFGDDLRIKQILNNLLSNAIKYTARGRIKLSIRHWAEDGDVSLRFVVEDTGQGIKPEDLEQLFEVFLRFNTEANHALEGTGLGLSITRQLVELMDGTIEVKSEFGQGSVFAVTVKQKKVECDAIGTETAENLRNFKFTDTKQKEILEMNWDPMPYGTVLIVDDVDINLYVAEELLLSYGLNIETASSGFETLDKVKSGKTYDIIFMDHMMPQMDGIETTRNLRALGYTGTIVALTANALVGNDKMFEENEFDEFISKPIGIQKLNAVLNRFIRDRHS